MGVVQQQFTVAWEMLSLIAPSPSVIYTYIYVIMWMKIVRCLKYLPYMVCVLSLHFRQLQAALYSIIMSIGLNTVTSLSEMCHSGQIISICKYMYTCMCNCHNIARQIIGTTTKAIGRDRSPLVLKPWDQLRSTSPRSHLSAVPPFRPAATSPCVVQRDRATRRHRAKWKPHCCDAPSPRRATAHRHCHTPCSIKR